MQTAEVEAVGLVTSLAGTGSDPLPSLERSALIDDMQARGVESPNQVLASGNTAIVLVRAYLRPGIQKGDRFDVEVRVPSRSETESLRNGWLMETRLKNVAVVNNQVHDGHVWAVASGPILTEPGARGGEDAVKLGRGRILGGGICLRDRPLGLVLKTDHQNVANSSAVGAAINQRFHTFQQGIKTSVATPRTNERIDLIVHPRYQDNVPRYLQVIGSLALRETAAQRTARMTLLERQLLDPVTAAIAALRLEALGRDGVKILLKGIESDDHEVRFFSAEALAYLDEPKAAEPLVEAARDEPAFRVFALTALSAMDDFAAYDALRKLLDVPSAETRYGAFRALWAMNPRDEMIAGEDMKGRFSLHRLDTAGPPMVHVTRSFRPEIVLFGGEPRLLSPAVLEAGKEIIVQAKSDDEVTVSKFTVGQPDQKRTVTNRLDEIIRAIAELGGSYPDVVEALQQARGQKTLVGRLEVEAVPQAGRTYERQTARSEKDEAPEMGFRAEVTRPLPDLFPKLRSGNGDDRSLGETAIADADGETERTVAHGDRPRRRLFGNIRR